MRILYLLFVAILAACASPPRLGEGLPNNDEEFGAWMAAMHADHAQEISILAAFEGVFDYAARFALYPSATPFLQEGQCTFTPQFGGSWMIGHMESEGVQTSLILLGVGDRAGEFLMSVLGPTGAITGGGRRIESDSEVTTIDFDMTMADPLDASKAIQFKRRFEIRLPNDILGIDYREDDDGSLVPFSRMQFIRRDTTAQPRQ
jgi:hypothetical protein